MSRLSYGGGMFSPLRCDTSMNDGTLNAARESDIFKQWEDICIGESLENNEVFIKEENCAEKKVSALAEKPNDSLNGNNREKNLSTSSDSSKLSYITTRKKTSRQSNPENLKTSTSASKEVKTNRKKDSLPKYVSVRSEAGKGNEFRPSKSRLSVNSYTTPLPRLSEEQFEAKRPETAHSSENNARNANSAQCDVKKISNAIDRKVKKQNPLASPKKLTCNGNEVKSDKCLTTDSEVQTDLLTAELNLPSSKTLGDSVSYNYQSTSISNLPISSKPQQIQTNLIEKIVKDTVSFEFDGIRQMLYHHQLSLLKYIDKSLGAERQISSLLIKYNEELTEENKRLREEVTAYQNFFKA